jgi:hypothetical protein
MKLTPAHCAGTGSSGWEATFARITVSGKSIWRPQLWPD